MLIRRCAILFLQPRESVGFDLTLLFQGESGLDARQTWVALAPHLETEVEVDAVQREVLGRIGETRWVERCVLEAEHGEACIEALLQTGLLLSDAAASASLRARDETLRESYWKPLCAAAHYFSRWEAVDAGEVSRHTALQSTADLVERYGTAPAHFHTRVDATQRIVLPAPETGALDALLRRRATCRNFDAARPVLSTQFTRLLHTVFAAQATVQLAANSAALKKNSPSGGGLHATGAYLLVQRVEGVTPGLYHYHCGDHALERLSSGAGLAATDADGVSSTGASATGDANAFALRLRALAQRCVAGQPWFADAAVLVMLVPRFRRSFWKYRDHAKAYRALVLDAGHLSQTLYLAATELGLGAFITAAVNEIEIERAFGLEAREESPIAVCGFGWRGAERMTVEFDPLGRVWNLP